MPSVGSNGVWVVEGVTDYDGDLWHVVLILELDEEGRIRRDTRSYPRPIDPPAWRRQWVEPLEPGADVLKTQYGPTSKIRANTCRKIRYSICRARRRSC